MKIKFRLCQKTHDFLDSLVCVVSVVVVCAGTGLAIEMFAFSL